MSYLSGTPSMTPSTDPDGRGSRPQNILDVISGTQNPTLGVALTIPSTVVAQLIGQLGSDFVFIDMEHSPISAELMTQMVHAIVASSRGACFPIVRVPSQGVEWIKWALDSGAAGIVIPMVNNKSEMEQIIDRALFAPRGSRSFGPSRAPWGLPDGPQGGVGAYFQRALKGQVGIFPMIESAEGVANVEDILSVEGVSGVFVGPMDLRLSLGLNGADGTEPAFKAALEKICGVAKKWKKLVGTVAIGDEATSRRTLEGMDFLVVSVDTGVMTAGLGNDLKRAKQVATTSSSPSL